MWEKANTQNPNQSITANAKFVMVFASCPLLNGGHSEDGVGHPGAKTRPAMVGQRTCANFVKNSVGATDHNCQDQPWSLGAVTSRPSFESSFKPIRRSRPRARKIRRRLMALAGATDKRINGSSDAVKLQNKWGTVNAC